jgi:hypothetical protein
LDQTVVIWVLKRCRLDSAVIVWLLKRLRLNEAEGVRPLDRRCGGETVLVRLRRPDILGEAGLQEILRVCLIYGSYH